MMTAGCAAEPDTLALIGGGRWARVFASVLADLDLPFRSVVVVSQSAVSAGGASGGDERFAGFAVLPTVEAAIGRRRLGAAIIANAARAHVASAEPLIRARIPVLIEKPAAMTLAEARSLLELGEAHNVCVAPGLSYLHASYLRRFAARSRSSGELRRISLEWRDPAGEVRHGERKSYDPGISIAHDVMPHVWSILSAAIGIGPPDIEAKTCRIAKGGRSVEYELDVGGLPCRITLERDALARRRRLFAETTGDPVEIDFAVEPGIIASGTTIESGDPQWAESPRPLARQIGEFIAVHRERTSEASKRALLGSVALAESCDILLKERQREWIGPTRAPDELLYAFRDLSSARFYEEGGGRPGDVRGLDTWVEDKLRLFRAGGAALDPT